MSGVFPDTVTGGVIIRDDLGNPTNPPDVQNAYVPPSQFVMSCLPTAIPSTCEGRITPAQINAIVSELLSLAVCWDPDGPWNCTSVNNLCNAFQTMLANMGVFIGEEPPVMPHAHSFWYESDTGILYFWYNDGNTTQWVQANGVVVDGISIIGAGVAGRPIQVGVVDSGTY